VGRLSPGDYIGETAMLGGLIARPATLRAETRGVYFELLAEVKEKALKRLLLCVIRA
jgi:CRP-like cAMP-binding protein